MNYAVHISLLNQMVKVCEWIEQTHTSCIRAANTSHKLCLASVPSTIRCPLHPPLCSGRPNMGVTTDTTGRDASTKPELIKVSKLERPCLALIDLYQNTGIHAVQMLAHSAEGSVEVNKQSLIRLHRRTSYHLGNLVMLDNFILHLRWGSLRWDGLMEASLLPKKCACHITHR